MAVASAGPYASLHLAPDRQPHQHPTTHSVKALKAKLAKTLSFKTFVRRFWTFIIHRNECMVLDGLGSLIC